MNIGQRIKQKRESIGLTVDQLALKLNINRATIYRYENNFIEKLPITVLEPLAKALNTSPSYLMGWQDEAIIEPIAQSRNTVVAIGRGGEKTTYEISDENAKLVNDFLETLSKKNN